MRRKSNKIRNLAIYGVIGVIAYALIFQGGLPFAEAGTFEIKIPPPASQAGISGFINCSLQSKLTTIETRGATIETYSGNWFAGSPSFSLTDDGTNMAGVVLQPQISCYQSTGNPIIVDRATLQVDVYANGQLIKSDKKSSSRINTGDGKMTNLMYFSMYSNDLEPLIKQKLGSGDYPVKLTFYVHGDLKVYYANYSSLKYDFKIPTRALSVDGSIAIKSDVDLDPDGDRIRGEYDKCPDQKENFNGFEDGDGCPDSPPEQREANSEQPDPATDPDNAGVINNAEILYNIQVNYAGGDQAKTFSGSTIELSPQSLLGSEEFGNKQKINKVIVSAYMIFDDENKDWTLHESDLVGGFVMNFMGKDIDLGKGTVTGAYKTSTQDIMNKGWGLFLGKQELTNPSVISKLASVNKDASISPIDIKLTYNIEGEVQLKKLGQVGIYEGAVISSLDISDLRYGNISGSSGTNYGDDDVFQSTENKPCPDNMVQDSINKECVPEDPQNEGQPLPKSNPTPTSFKNVCNDAGWFVQGDSCVPPVEDDTPSWHGDPTKAGGETTITCVREGMTPEQAIASCTSDPIQLTFIIIAIVIFLGLIGGLVMRGRTNYGSGLQIPRPY
jgi:hypothetical protein